MEKKKRETVLKVISSELTITRIPGAETIASAKDIFPGFIDPRFKKLELDKTGEENQIKKAFVSKIKKEQSIHKIRESIDRIKKLLVFEEWQIISFCKHHPHRISPKGLMTFILKDKNDNFFLAIIGSHRNKLNISCVSFESFFKDDGKEKRFKEVNHYLVIPRLKNA